MKSTPDRDLVLSAQSGDRQAFGHLVDRYHAMTLGIAKRFVHTPEIADELAQEALLQAYLSLKNLRDPERFKSWLYDIAQNTCRNHLHNRKPVSLSLDDLVTGEIQVALDHPDPYQKTESKDLYRRVLQAIENDTIHTGTLHQLTPDTIDTRHLLLALTKAKRDVAAQILAEHDMTYETLK